MLRGPSRAGQIAQEPAALRVRRWARASQLPVGRFSFRCRASQLQGVEAIPSQHRGLLSLPEAAASISRASRARRNEARSQHVRAVGVLDAAICISSRCHLTGRIFRSPPVDEHNGTFLLLLANVALFVADHIVHLPMIKAR